MQVLLEKDSQYSLQELVPFWKDFASKLELPKENINSIAETFKKEDHLKAVFSMWLNKEEDQLKYPFTWRGLGDLIEACSKQKEATKLFENFLV